MEAEKELGVSGRAAIIEYGIDRFNDYCRKLGATTTPSSGRRSCTARPAGSTSRTTTRPWTSPTWRASSGRFKQLYDKGLLYESFRVMPYSWAAQTPLSNFETRLDDSYRERTGSGHHRALRAGARGRRRPTTSILAWTTTPWTLPSNLALAVGPDIDYAILERERRAPDPRRRTGCPGTRRSSTATSASGCARAASWSAAATSRSSRTSPGPRTPSASWARSSWTPRRAPASSTWLRASARTTWTCAGPTASPWSCPVDDAGCFTGEVSDYAGQHVFEANKPIIRDLKERGALFKHEIVRPQLPALLAHRHAADLPRHELVVRQGHGHPRPHGRAQPGDQLDPRAREGRPLRQLARRRARLVDQPQPLLGLADPGLEERRPRLPADGRLRQPRRARARLRRAAGRPAPPGHRRAGAPQPRRPERQEP